MRRQGVGVIRGQCVVRECVVTMRRQGGMRPQRAMRRQGMCRQNALSRGLGVIANVSSQCVVSVSCKSHTQAAGALYKNIYINIDNSIYR